MVDAVPEFAQWVNEQPVKVKEFVVVGNKITRSSFIQAHLEPVKSCKTYAEVIRALDESLSRLHQLRIFNNCTATLDTIQGSTDLKVRLKIEEPVRRTGLETSVMTDTGLTVTGEFRNAFGGAEKVSISRSYNKQGASYSDQKSSSLSLVKPLRDGSRSNLVVTLFEQFNNPSFSEKSRGLSTMVRSGCGRHSGGWSGTWRDVRPQAPSKSYQGMSEGLLRDCGTSVKSSLSYEYTLDRRDNPALPTKGSFLSVSTELAGLGGDTNFLKGQFLLQRCFPIHPRLSLDLSCTAGHILPWSSFTRPDSLSQVKINDRFFFGGPLFLRGFKFGGIGPRSRDDPLGGDLFAAACARLSTPLGFLGGVPVRGHVFVDAGNLVSTNHRSPNATFREGLSTARASCGFGVALGVGGRLELNVTAPLSRMEQDVSPAHHFHIGFGLRFL